MCTVNMEIFMIFLFSRNFANKQSQKAKITLSFTDVGKSCRGRQFLTWQMYLNSIRENEILVKNFQFTVPPNIWRPALKICGSLRDKPSLRGF